MNAITRGKAVGQLESASKLSPEALAAKVAGATQPLNRGLVQAINNQVQADMASRGLAQAPGVFSAEEEQTLAPFQQANQQRAMQLILAQLGIPGEILQNTQGSANVMPAIMQLMLRNPNAFPPTNPNPFNYWAATNANPNVPAATPSIVPSPPDIGSTVPGFDPSAIASILNLPTSGYGGGA
jgi:hypothetical protein